MKNSQSWQDWVATHGPQLVLFARRWALDHAEAEDIVQEAFVRFWQTRGSVRDPLAYLWCVRNVATDAARSQQARNHREAIVAGSQRAAPVFADALEDEERRQQIAAALAELPTEQAEVVTLKVWSALTFAQIAEVTSTPAGTVASRYRYAIDRLRGVLVEKEIT